MFRFSAVIVFGIAIVVTAHAALVQHQTALGHIDRAAGLLFSAESPDMQKGVASLLDAVAELTQGPNVPATVGTAVRAAREELESGRPMVDDKVGRLLRDAYQGLHAGTPFRHSYSEDVAELSTRLKRQMDSARALLAEGKADESARALLAVALSIVTPVQQ